MSFKKITSREEFRSWPLNFPQALSHALYMLQEFPEPGTFLDFYMFIASYQYLCVFLAFFPLLCPFPEAG